jgi:HEXXH motif-containing protein
MTQIVSRPTHHQLSASQFDAIAAGGGGPDIVRLLLSAERSRRLMLLRALLDAVRDTPEALGPLPPADAAWELLTRAQQRRPAEFDAVLLHPQVGSWVAHSLRRLRGISDAEGPLWVDIGHLFAVACAAAVATGVPLRTTVPLRHGTLMLPLLGLARLPVADRWGTAEARTDSGGLILRVPGHRTEVRLQMPDSPHWWGLRRLRSRAAGREFTVCLDDIDPYRDLGSPIAPERLDGEQVRRWQRLFDGGWRILTETDPPTAQALAAGMKSVVPLPPAFRWSPRSASSGDAFGAALISSPPDAASLASLLVHEFQHTKLGAVYHLLTLYQDDGRARFYAPWRDDPRPLSGLLQGVYAFLGVTGFWRLRRLRAVGPDRDLASFEFALWRQQTWRTLRVLRADAGLSALGRRFADGMTERMRSWWADPVPPEIAVAAKLAAFDHRIGWRLRHLGPDPDRVADLARAWIAGAEPAGRHPVPTLLPDLAASWSHARTSMIRLKLASPDEHDLSRVAAAGGGLDPVDEDPVDEDPVDHDAVDDSVDLTPADLALLDGRYRDAVDGYVPQLSAEPDQPDGWTGLLLALAAADPASRPLLRQPELLPATHREIRRRQPAPDPRRLARWLAGALPAGRC